ncbi:hypothetical protein HK102_008407 [Quaeritorhiza haematococci]|nr:hypothetical protein HK102_008407 [Quaeritorhiza haematococci]
MPPPKKLDWARVAIVLSLIQAIFICAIESYIFSQIFQFTKQAWGSSGSGSQPFILVYFGLYIFAQVFQLWLVYDAFRSKNTMQVVAVAVFNLCSFFYSIVQVRQVDRVESCLSSRNAIDCPTLLEAANVTEISRHYMDSTRPVLYVNIGAMLLFVLLGFFVAQRVYVAYGWAIWETHGAGLRTKRMLQRYHTFILLLKLNIYFSIGIVAQMVGAIFYTTRQQNLNSPTPEPTPTNGSNSTIPSDILNPTASGSSVFKSLVLPLSIILSVVFLLYYTLGYFGVRRGSYFVMSSFLFIIAASFVSVLVALVFINLSSQFQISIIWLSTFAVIQILLNIATFLNGVWCMWDFHRGLPQLLKEKPAALAVEGMSQAPRTQPVLD